MADNTGSEVRILGIFAHPDDAEFTCAGSAAVGQPGRTDHVCRGDGRRRRQQRPKSELDELVRVRQAEQTAASRCWAFRKFSFSAIRMGPSSPRSTSPRADPHHPPAQAGQGDLRRPVGDVLRQRLHQPSRPPRRSRSRALRGLPRSPTRPISPNCWPKGSIRTRSRKYTCRATRRT